MTRNLVLVAVFTPTLSTLLLGPIGCSPLSPASPSIPLLSDSLLTASEPQVRRQILQAHQKAQEDPHATKQVGRVGMLLHAYGHYESAGLFYRFAASQAPSEFRWIYYLGLVERESGQPEMAAQRFKRALRLRPDNLPTRLHLGIILTDLNRSEESIPHLQRILEKGRDNPLGHYELGRAYTRQNRDDDARESFARACELAPDFGAAQYALALSYRNRGDAPGYERHAALFEAYHDSRPALDDRLQGAISELRVGAVAHFDKARQRQAEGRNEEAIVEYRKALRIRPDHPTAHSNLMGLFLHLGRLDEAEQQYRVCLELNPDIAEMHYNYGILLRARGQPEQAIVAFERALDINPSYADAHSNLALLLAGLDQGSRATTHLRKTLEIDRNHRLARYNLARLLLQKGETSESIQLLSGALSEEDDKTAAIEALLANAYSTAGQLREAEGHGRRAVSLAEKYRQVDLAWTARYSLGRNLFFMRKYRETIDLLSPAAESEDDRTPSLLLLLASCYSRVGNQELATQHAARALNLARRHGQQELAATIEQVLGMANGDRQ